MQEELSWDTLESRITMIQLMMLYKNTNDNVDIPAGDYLTFTSSRTRFAPSKKQRQYSSNCATFKFSSFPNTISNYDTYNQLQWLRLSTWYSSSGGHLVSNVKVAGAKL